MVEEVKDEYGLNRSLEMVGLSKSVWYYRKNQKIPFTRKYMDVLGDLYQVIEDHPSYGYRRATSELRDTYEHDVGEKVVRRLMKKEDLQIRRRVNIPKPNVVREILTKLGDRMNLVAGLDNIDLLEVLYTDFTEIVYAQGSKKAQLMPIIGHTSKVCFGWSLGRTCTTDVALEAWKKAKQNLAGHGFTAEGVIVHHDQGSVYTGYRWLQEILVASKTRVSYALRGALDNPAMESFNGHLKPESRDLFFECESLEQLHDVVRKQITYYNTDRRHSSLGNVAPLKYLKSRR